MQPKGALAIVLAFFLFAVSSWASACELSCSLEPPHSECLPPAQAEANPHSPRTSNLAMDMDMDMAVRHSAHENAKPQSSKTMPHSHPRMTPACMNNAWSEFSDSAYPVNNAAAALRQHAQFVRDEVSPSPVMLVRRFEIDTSPPGNLAAAPSLFTLRI